jgi:hypothetical protein
MRSVKQQHSTKSSHFLKRDEPLTCCRRRCRATTGNRCEHKFCYSNSAANVIDRSLCQWLSSALKAMGYDSVYAEKTREAMGAEGQVDGCALCWRSDKFFLRDSRVVSFNAKAMMLEEQLPKCAELLTRLPI